MSDEQPARTPPTPAPTEDADAALMKLLALFPRDAVADGRRRLESEAPRDQGARAQEP